MFLGHFGVALGAKRAAPALSLGLLILAAQFLDLLWPTLLLVGVERVAIVPGITAVTPLDFQHYPISHSLLTACGWGLLVGGGYWLTRRASGGALVLGLLVVSHWLLDAVVHRPDLPLVPGGALLVGFGLWDSHLATLVVELALLGGGAWLYAQSTEAGDAVGRWAFYGLIAFLLAIEVGNLTGPPPPSVAAIAWVGQAQWLFVLWGFWVDGHRRARA